MTNTDPPAGAAPPVVPGRRGTTDSPTVPHRAVVEASAAVARRRRLSPRQVFWSTFGLLFVVTALWSVASPVMAGLDEPAHAIKAASVVRGELTGESFAVDPGASALIRAQQEGRGLVDVTALFTQLHGLPTCFAFRKDVPASCQEPVVADADAASRAVTSASRYNPLYYLFVGVPSLFPGSAVTIYLMRLVSALLASALIAMAFRTIAELPRSLWPALATTAAVTPMVMFMNSTVNPQAVELAGALTLWVALLALQRNPDPALLRRRLARLTVATMFFVNARGLGPLFLAVIVLAAVACSPLSQLAAVLRDRRSWPYLAACAAVSLAAVGWIRFQGSLATSTVINFPEYADTETILELTLGSTTAYISQTLGLFGWQDVTLPGWTYQALAAVLLSVIVAGFAVARWRDRLVMLALGVATLVTPLVAHYVQARYIGPFWQGRYILPLAFGVPVVAGFALLDRVGDTPAWITRRLVGCGFLAVVGLQTLTFAMNLHRYVNGWSGPWFETTDSSWAPPLPPLLLVGLTALGWAALTAAIFNGSNRGNDETVPSSPAPEADDDGSGEGTQGAAGVPGGRTPRPPAAP